MELINKWQKIEGVQCVHGFFFILRPTMQCKLDLLSKLLLMNNLPGRSDLKHELCNEVGVVDLRGGHFNSP